MTVTRLREGASAAVARLARTRTIWLGAAVVVLAAAGYLLSRRSRQLPPSAADTYPAVGSVVSRPASTEELPVGEPATAEPAVVAPVDEVADKTEEKERPLATPIRVAIVVAALIAFFAISLLVTKR